MIQNDVQESSSMLKQQSALLCSRLLLNASAQNEDRLCQFLPTRATKIGYHSNIP